MVYQGMTNTFAFFVVTVDGFYAGPNDEFDWPVVDDEFMAFSVEQLGEIDTLVFGRTTYEGMASYWPTPQAKDDDPAVAGIMNDIPKVVVSRTLESASWNNTRLVRDVSDVAALKPTVAVFGSSDLVVSLLGAGLVDELRIMVMPVALGKGKSLFRTLEGQVNLKLTGTRTFDSGNVLLYYRPSA